MVQSLYFYDLETSGFRPKSARIMQFGGQRTNMKLEPIGEPHNVLIKITPDVLPEPDAVLVTGITPQKTISEGITEAEFLKLFYKEIATKDTLFIGFNNIRFDDEFMRYLNWRNFYDAYEWHWSSGRSRWDLLDLVRMTRALRPDGIKWPFDADGNPANRLELLTGVNKLDHIDAHDALADVNASISVAQLIREKQPKLFAHLMNMRDKTKVAKLVEAGQPFVYSSGKYPSEYEKTTVVSMVGMHPRNSGAFVYDLRYDPSEFTKLPPKKLFELWSHRCKEWPCSHPQLPVKLLQYNRCPAIAPLGVLDNDSQTRIKLNLKTIAENEAKLKQNLGIFKNNLLTAQKDMDKLQQARMIIDESDVDSRLYDDFINPADKPKMQKVREVEPAKLNKAELNFSDQRLSALLPLYKARNFPHSLSGSEKEVWDKFCQLRLTGGGQNSPLAKYFNRLDELKSNPNQSKHKQFILEELKLYGESLLPMEM